MNSRPTGCTLEAQSPKTKLGKAARANAALTPSANCKASFASLSLSRAAESSFFPWLSPRTQDPREALYCPWSRPSCQSPATVLRVQREAPQGHPSNDLSRDLWQLTLTLSRSGQNLPCRDYFKMHFPKSTVHWLNINPTQRNHDCAPC